MAILEGSDGPLRELALFAGAGGGILGGLLLGWRTVCAVEYDTYAASVLVARQNDGLLEPFPIWDDVRTFDGREWTGRVDVVSGGFPCQDISSAGKGAGIDGERSGLWTEMARIVSEVRPRFVFVENSPLLVQRGLAVVLTDLAKLGYDARWGIVSAADAIWLAGDPCIDHERNRIWIVATNRNRDGEQQGQVKGVSAGYAEPCGIREITDAVRIVRESGTGRRRVREVGAEFERGWWSTEPSVGRVADGVACRMDRLAAIGNGQVPSVAALAWRILTGELH